MQSKDHLPDRISLIPDQFVNPAPIPNAIKDVIEEKIENNFELSAICDFLFRKKPRFVDGPKKPYFGTKFIFKDFLNSIITAVTSLDNSYLCIQGPPGSR